MANKSGQAYAFMTMTPVLPGHEDGLNQVLSGWGTGADSPLARLRTIHFARLLVLHDLVYQGPPQVRDTLQSAYLIFISNFDGDLEPYLESMLDVMGEEVQQAWAHCVGFPGTADRARCIAYLVHNQLDTTFFVTAYPEATVSDVLTSLALRSRIADFAIAGQTMDPATLMATWRAEFAQVSR
jgi:hypothetical protein